MENLKKRSVAFLIALVVVAGSILFGSHRSLGNEVDTVTDLFYDGVYDEVKGYTESSIYSQLSNRAATALKMVSTGADSGIDDASVTEAETALRQARNDMLELMQEGAGPRTLYEADQALTQAADRYYGLIQPLLELAGDTQEDNLAVLEDAQSNLQSAARVIADSGYNDAVRQFNQDVLGRFPANLLKTIAFVSSPELFA